MDGCSNSRWHTLCAEVSASYVEHVLKKFYIPEEIQGRLLNIFILYNLIYQIDGVVVRATRLAITMEKHVAQHVAPTTCTMVLRQFCQICRISSP